MNLETTTKTPVKQNTGKLKDYKSSSLIREFYKFVANNNLREAAYRGLKVALEEKKRILNSNKAETLN